MMLYLSGHRRFIMEINAHLENLTDRIVRLEVQTEQMRQRNDGLMLVVGWLLARHPGDDALRFLSSQANELDGHQKHVEYVALLDDLREEIEQWHAQWPAAQKWPS